MRRLPATASVHRRLPQPAEREWVSRTPRVQATQHLVRRNSNRAFAVKVIKPSIKFFALRICERNCFWGQ